MDTTFVGVVTGVGFFLVLLIARASGLIGRNSPAWRKTLVLAVGFAAFLMAVVWLTPGFDARPLVLGVAAFVGALFGASGGLLVSYADSRDQRRAG